MVGWYFATDMFSRSFVRGHSREKYAVECVTAHFYGVGLKLSSGLMSGQHSIISGLMLLASLCFGFM